MITVLDMLQFIAILFLAMMGFALLKDQNIFLALIGAVAGGYIGLRLGRLPQRYVIRRERKKLAALSVEDLKTEICNIQTRPRGWKLRFTPNYLLMELRARGEDVTCYIEFVLSLLESEGQLSRAFGIGALLSAFPHLAKHLRGYNPANPAQDCRDRVAQLRKILAEQTDAAAASHGQ